MDSKSIQNDEIRYLAIYNRTLTKIACHFMLILIISFAISWYSLSVTWFSNLFMNYSKIILVCNTIIYFSSFIIAYFNDNHPTNLICMYIFTLSQSVLFSLGLIDIDVSILFQCFIITISIFVGLLVFSLNSNEILEFSVKRAFKYSFATLCLGIIGLFMCLSRVDIIYLLVNVLVIMIAWLYIILDIHYIVNKDGFNPDNYVRIVLDIYIDFINLLINIIKLLSSFSKGKK